METPPPVKKPLPVALRILFGVVGVIAIIGGVLQVKKGVGELRGSKGNPEAQALINASEAAVNEGNRTSLEAQPVFQKLLDDTDAKGLAAVRAEPEPAQKIDALLGQAAAQFHLASQKSAGAGALEKNERLKAFLEAKSRVYELNAQAREINQEIVKLVMDSSLTKMDDVVAKVLEAGKRRDELLKTAQAADTEATEAVKQAKGAK